MKKTPDSQAALFNPRLLLAFILCAVGALLAMLGFASNPTPGWSIVTSPNANVAQMFNDVACASASDCWAVGTRYNSEVLRDVTLIGRWNGTSWTIVNSPNATDPINANIVEESLLEAVSCTSTSDCWAVGRRSYYPSEQPLIEHWTGGGWAIVTAPNTGGTAALKDVTCLSASECWAVGYSYYVSSPDQTLIEQWNGTTWVIVPSPNAGVAQNNHLTAVSCTSGSDCWAVGYYYTGSVNQTLIERWDGKTWSIVASPNTSANQNNQFNAMTCLSSSDCWAAGTFNAGNIDQPLTAHWNGTTWTIVSSPAATSGASLKSVACKSASECWAVGKVSNVDHPFMQRWNGTSWGIVSSPVAKSSLNGITCLSGGDCWTVGYDISFSGFKETLAQRWDGTSWMVVNSPNVVDPALSNYLRGVACASASDCWAVGYYNSVQASPALIEHWDGVSWTIVSSASADASGYSLNGVACAGPSNCWAVGNYNNAQTLIERWDGTSWSIVTSPDAGLAYLTGVTCTSASNCWAVGYYLDGAGNAYTLIERWNGTSWGIVNSPSVGTNFVSNSLRGVTCSSASDCWAVGFWIYNDGESQSQGPIIERWNGTSWEIVPSPPTPGSGVLWSVACPSASACWAVGSYPIGVEESSILILRWNGTSWNVENLPNPGFTSSGFAAIACASPFACWAVGSDDNGSPPGRNQTLIEQSDGSTWKVVPPSTANTSLYGVTCVSASECWAVGYDVAFGRTFIAEYSSTIPPLASVVSRKVHGSAGRFDINLPLIGTRGVECRSPGSTGTPGVDYKLVFSFVNNLTGCGTASTGSLSSGPGLNQCTVDLTGVPNAQYITVTLNNVLDVRNNTGNVAGTMGVLIGDVNANGLVNSTDTSLVQAQSGQPVTSSNFRTDINTNGLINSTDTSIVRSESGTGLPSSP